MRILSGIPRTSVLFVPLSFWMLMRAFADVPYMLYVDFLSAGPPVGVSNALLLVIASVVAFARVKRAGARFWDLLP